MMSRNILFDYQNLKEKATQWILNYENIGEIVYDNMKEIIKNINKEMLEKSIPLILVIKGGYALRYHLIKNEEYMKELHGRPKKEFEKNTKIISDLDTTLLYKDQKNMGKILNKNDWIDFFRRIKNVINTEENQRIIKKMNNEIQNKLLEKYQNGEIDLRELGINVEKYENYINQIEEKDIKKDELSEYKGDIKIKIKNIEIEDKLIITSQYILFRLLGKIKLFSDNGEIKKYHNCRKQNILDFEILDVSNDFDNIKMRNESLIGYDQLNENLYILNFLNIIYDNISMINEQNVTKPHKRCQRIGFLLYLFKKTKMNIKNKEIFFQVLKNTENKYFGKNLTNTCINAISNSKNRIKNIDHIKNSIQEIQSNIHDLDKIVEPYMEIIDSFIDVLLYDTNEIRNCLDQNSEIWVSWMKKKLKKKKIDHYDMGGLKFKNDIKNHLEKTNLENHEKEFLKYIYNNTKSYDFDLNCVVDDEKKRSELFDDLSKSIENNDIPDFEQFSCTELKIITNIDFEFLKEKSKNKVFCNNDIKKGCFVLSNVSEINEIKCKIWTLNVLILDKITNTYHLKTLIELSVFTEQDFIESLNIIRSLDIQTQIFAKRLMDLTKFCRSKKKLSDDDFIFATIFVNLLLDFKIEVSLQRYYFYSHFKKCNFQKVLIDCFSQNLPVKFLKILNERHFIFMDRIKTQKWYTDYFIKSDSDSNLKLNMNID